MLNLRQSRSHFFQFRMRPCEIFVNVEEFSRFAFTVAVFLRLVSRVRVSFVRPIDPTDPSLVVLTIRHRLLQESVRENGGLPQI